MRGAFGLFAMGIVSFVTSPIAAQEPGTLVHIHETPIFNMIRTEIDYAPQNDGVLTWDVDGWVGGDDERVWLRSEGEATDGTVEIAETQVYYGWNVDPFWDALVGLRHDFEPTSETYLAASVVGLAPYFFETEASLFVSTEGDASMRLKQSFDLLITQRLIAEPHLEVNLFTEDVPERDIGAGLSNVELSLQFRYEIVRRLAPYVEAVWSRKLGETARLARADGDDAEDTTIRLGLRFWF